MVDDAASTCLLVRTEGATRVLTLNRPEVRNAIDPTLRARFLRELEEADASSDVRVVVVTGTDPAFCSGVDLKALAGPPRPGLNPGDAVRAVRKPVLAAVNGACVTGGFEIALSCDFVVASERAAFADSHAQRGRPPGKGMWGMSALLPEAVGVRRAKELSLTGRLVPAHEALAMGLVNHVVSHDELLPFTLRQAEAVAKAPAEATDAWLSVYDLGRGRTLEERVSIERAHGANKGEEQLGR